ncbi:MAG: hypothetical protein MI892_03320 [Desulfobacterales bacterium]|nr:hypothetical protein [Desulfobacterales bacterium]
MKKTLVLIVVSAFIIYGGLCLAGTPKGLKKSGKTPKGFSQGEKSGWEGEYPKGWDNFSKEEKEKWQNKHRNVADDDDLIEIEDREEKKSDKDIKSKKKKHKKGKKKE